MHVRLCAYTSNTATQVQEIEYEALANKMFALERVDELHLTDRDALSRQ